MHLGAFLLLCEIYYSYDNNSNLLTQTDPNNYTNVFTYDVLNQLQTKTTSEGVTSFTYNSKGEILTAQNPKVGLTFTYDLATEKLPIQATSTGLGAYSSKIPASVINYQYNNLKQLTQISKPNTSFLANLNQDTIGRLNTVTGTMGSYTMSYDNLNRLTRINQTGAAALVMSQNFTYDTQGFLQSLINRQGTAGTILSQQTYLRDQNGMRTAVNTTSGSKVVNRTLAYDGDQQLTGSTISSSGTSQSFTNETYNYDSIHNRTSDEGGTYTYDAKKQQLTEDYRYFYFYDENGNLLKKQVKGHLDQVTSYTYNSENQMIGFKEFDSSSETVPIKEVSYTYDPMGRRVLKEIVDHVNTAKSYARAYVYHNQEIIEEYDGAQNLLAQYGHSYLRTDDPLTMKVTSAGVTAGLATSAATYSFLKDAQGTITEIANSSGSVIQRNYYNSFGKILSIRDSSDANVTSTPVIKTPFSFTGREYDEESGHYYYRARFYDPNTGRFLQKDPSPGKTTVPQTIVNSYTYAANNPWFYTDPSGKFLFLAALVPIFAFIGAALEIIVMSAFVTGLLTGLIQGIISLHAGKGFFTGFAEGFLSGAATGAVIGAAVVGIGVAGAALGYAATEVQVFSGLVLGGYGAIKGSQYGIGGALLGFASGFIGGYLGAGSAFNAYNEVATSYGAIGVSTPAYQNNSVIEPPVPDVGDFDTPNKPITLP